MSEVKAVSNPAAAVDGVEPSSAEWDRLVVERVRAGDVAAFDGLIRKYRERLYSVIYNLTSNREDAADMTQEAFIKAFRSINRFKGKSSFFTWIYRIAVNTTLTHLKRNRSRRFFSFDNIDEEVGQSEILEILASKTRTEKPALISELQEKLNEAIQGLSIKHRTVLVLYEVEGLSHSDIAKIVKTTEGTVRSRLHYAKQQLQNQLKEYLD